MSEMNKLGKSEIDSRTFHLKENKNVFQNEKRLSDEVIYVYNRKEKKNFMGNTLEKPGMIVKRNKLGETKETD